MSRFARYLSVMVVGLASMALSQPASAAFLGNVSLNATTTIATGADLSNTPLLSFSFFIGGANTAIVSASNGSFGGINVGSSFGTGTLDLNNLANFTMTSQATGGVFKAIASDGMGNFSAVTTKSASFLDVYLIGTFTGAPLSSQGTPASLRLSFNYSGGGTASDSLSLAVPTAAVVPEPASIGMVVIGLGGVFASRRFRRKLV